MNRAESERLGGLFQQLGYKPATVVDKADLILLNSCVVRQSAEERVVNKIKALEPLKKSNPALRLALTGCLVDSDLKGLKKRFPHVDYFLKPGEQPYWLGITEAGIFPLQPQVSTFVPIIQGCNNFCSYCVVPYRRGREKSRPMLEIVNEVKELVNSGVKEIILLGQNVDSYGHDLPDNPDLASLLHELNSIENLARIRFLTNHPKDMSERLIGAIAQLDRVCQQINLPLQSGDETILKAMKRGYTAGQYRQLVERIREHIPQIALSTDVIVGFPSETQEQFSKTAEMLRQLRFDSIHSAVYSPRPGTFATEEYEDNIPAPVKKERLNIIEQLHTQIATEINAGLLGKKVEVLVEGRKKGRWYGRSRSGKLIFFTCQENLMGKLAEVKIENTSPWSLQGEVISNK